MVSFETGKSSLQGILLQAIMRLPVTNLLPEMAWEITSPVLLRSHVVPVPSFWARSRSQGEHASINSLW